MPRVYPEEFRRDVVEIARGVAGGALRPTLGSL